MSQKRSKKRGYVPQDRGASSNVDWSKAIHMTFANLKPSSTTISLRMPDAMLDEIKLMANKQDVPYQSLIKMILAERLSGKR